MKNDRALLIKTKAFLIRKFGMCLEATVSELRINCPFCEALRGPPDEDFKMYINPFKNVYNCFKCESCGQASQLAPIIDVDLIEFYETHPPKKEVVLDQKDPFEMPPINMVPLSTLTDEHPARMYLITRNFKHLCNSNDIYYCDDYRRNDFSFGPRLVFPIFQAGIYKGFQARAIYDIGSLPKYMGSLGMQKKTILYNCDRAFKQNELLVIVEGVFDCLRLPDNAVALLGKHLSEEQFRIITLTEYKSIVVLLDKDAQKEAKEIAHLFTFFNAYTATIPNGIKDLGEVTNTEEALNIINDASNLVRVY
jgi:hypothetical protein